MATGDKPSSGGGQAPRPEAEEQPFDRWLRKQLHAIYDPVVNEPIPAELLKAIDEDAARARQDALAAAGADEETEPSDTKRSS
jgi:hypothetical protein